MTKIYRIWKRKKEKKYKRKKENECKTHLLKEKEKQSTSKDRATNGKKEWQRKGEESERLFGVSIRLSLLFCLPLRFTEHMK